MGFAAAVMIREYHELTNHRLHRLSSTDPRILVDYQPMQPELRPSPFKAYDESLGTEPLPPLVDAALFDSAAVRRYRDVRGHGRSWFRAAGSAGNLSPLEVYLVMDGRVLHYEPLAHRVTPLGACAAGDPALVVTGVPWRTAWKYRERGFRHLYWDAGTMLGQLFASMPRARLSMGFVDAQVNALVGADGVDEFALAVVSLDGDGDGDGELVLEGSGDVARGSLSERSISFPLIVEAQRAGDLPSWADVDEWRLSARAGAVDDVGVTFGRPVADVVARRGSTRRFDATAVGPPELLAAVDVAGTPLNADFVAPGASLLEHEVLVHAIEGVRPVAGSRDAGRHLCLRQELGGDGCYTVFHCADLDDERMNARRYRCALVEAGVASSRLHLSAFALGYGATGLTFYDQEVRQWFGTKAWPMLVTAVGKPAYSYVAPSGRRGEPAALPSWG